jgi:hypothetical protein
MLQFFMIFFLIGIMHFTIPLQKTTPCLSHVQLVVNSQFIISTLSLMDQMTLHYNVQQF